MQVTLICRKCGKQVNVEVNQEDLQAYESGEKRVQDAFPYLSPDERELFISGICGECFDKMFPEEE